MSSDGTTHVVRASAGKCRPAVCIPQFSCVSDEHLATICSWSAAFVGVVSAFALVFSWWSGVANCTGPVMQGLLWGADWDLAERICCHNTRFAEPRGYLGGLDFFQSVRSTIVNSQAEGEPGWQRVTFFDSQCGVPLFVAPRGRSLDDWETESEVHGWPSFRPIEAVESNIVVDPGGEVTSTCGTHLGHNLPDADGDRYCINLVCIAGRSLLSNETRPGQAESGWHLTDLALIGLFISPVMCWFRHAFRSRADDHDKILSMETL